MLKLSKQQIQTLTCKANQDIEDSSIFSRFEAVSVHIWKCVSMALGMNPKQERVLFVTVYFRNRMKLPLAKRYFGNAVMALAVRSTGGELFSNSPSHCARRIREVIDGVTDEYVRSYLNCIKNIPDISSMRHFYTVRCPQGSFYRNPNLIITSWVGISLYEAMFCRDHVYMGPESLGYDRRHVLMPSQKMVLDVI